MQESCFTEVEALSGAARDHKALGSCGRRTTSQMRRARTDVGLLRSELLILLWVGFTDGDAVLTSIRAFGAQQVLGAEEIVEDWPDSRSNVCWGPYVDP
jgi:hypothetical protein